MCVPTFSCTTVTVVVTAYPSVRKHIPQLSLLLLPPIHILQLSLLLLPPRHLLSVAILLSSSKGLGPTALVEQCRRRSPLIVDELAEIILPFVSGLKWLNYNETTPTKRAPSLIVPLAPLYVQLRKVGGNLNFCKKQLTAAFIKIKDEQHSWFPRDEDALDWARTMAARMLLQSHHIQQAMIKNPMTKVVATFQVGGACSDHHGGE